MVRVKKNVVFKVFRDEILNVLNRLHSISLLMGKDIWVTSANDGKHSKKSYHYKNLALDIRIRNLTDDEIQTLLSQLDYFLNEKNVIDPPKSYYDIVLEKDHVHVEWDERRYRRENE